MKEVFEQIYEKPGAIWTHQHPPETLVNWLPKIPRGKALDVGCGEGTYARFLQKQGFEVTGIDFSENAIALAKRTVPNVTFLVQDVTTLSLTGFDFVFEWGVLHHLGDPEAHFATIAKTMNSEGRYFFASFDPSSSLYGTPGEKVRETSLGTTLYYYAKEDLVPLLEKHFTILKHERINLMGTSPDKKETYAHPGNAFLVKKT